MKEYSTYGASVLLKEEIGSLGLAPDWLVVAGDDSRVYDDPEELSVSRYSRKSCRHASLACPRLVQRKVPVGVANWRRVRFGFGLSVSLPSSWLWIDDISKTDHSGDDTMRVAAQWDPSSYARWTAVGTALPG